MKILIIGGTGTISSAITRQLAAEGNDLWLLNRGNRNSDLPQNVRLITGDIKEHPETQIEDQEFDLWCDRVIETMEASKRTLITFHDC
ncbi:MAG: NAD-dependent epimerase/dehydratase family protein [Bacteroidales bacterium]|nr:NAD-dependent epimerase/dehydratase family protein [Bacteroidales bacterium]